MSQADNKLTHTDRNGEARMVDVGEKPVTHRTAIARGICCLSSETADLIRANSNKKGDVLQVARIAGICAAKRTDELIPLCHSVPLDSVSIAFEWSSENRLQVTASARCTARTGVEMEAMVAVSVACLTVYDMCKSSDREMQIECIELIEKSGGVHGDFVRS